MQVKKQELELGMEKQTGSKLGKEYVKAVYCHSAYLTYMQSESESESEVTQSCPTLCDPVDCSPPGSFVHGIVQARILEWVAISFSNAWKLKVKVKLLSCVRLFATHGLQPTRLLCPWDFPGKSTGVGCHCLLRI